jgi:hypothetical protein
MKPRLLLSLTALVVIAVIVLGAAVYVHNHSNVYTNEERMDRRH